MASKMQQLVDCKAALAALETEIKEAKVERKTAKAQLEKAIQEGKPVSPFEKLLDSASSNLNALQRKEEELLKERIQLTRSSSSDDEVQELSPISESSPKRRKVDELIEKCKKYLFHTVIRERIWGCVTVISKRRAVTYAHKEHSHLKPEDIITIYSTEDSAPFNVKVVKSDAISDWVLMESDIDLCEKPPIWGPVVDGHRYIQLGLSITSQNESPFAISTGVVSSERTNKFGHALGSAGANPGDSGGGCYDESSGCLVGINVGCENIPISFENDSGAQIYDKISSRYASRAHIIPINSFQYV